MPPRRRASIGLAAGLTILAPGAGAQPAEPRGPIVEVATLQTPFVAGAPCRTIEGAPGTLTTFACAGGAGNYLPRLHRSHGVLGVSFAVERSDREPPGPPPRRFSLPGEWQVLSPIVWTWRTRQGPRPPATAMTRWLRADGFEAVVLFRLHDREACLAAVGRSSAAAEIAAKAHQMAVQGRDAFVCGRDEAMIFGPAASAVDEIATALR